MPTPTPTPIPIVTVTTQVRTVPPILLPSSSPSITDWIGSLATALSIIIIGGGLIWEIGRRRKDDKRRDAEQQDADAAQARLVSLTASGLHDSLNMSFGIFNDSDGAIYDTRLVVKEVAADDTLSGNMKLQIFAQDLDPLLHIGPHEKRELQAAIFYGPGVQPPPASQIGEGGGILRWTHNGAVVVTLRCSVIFTDSHGIRWIRQDRLSPRRFIEEAEAMGLSIYMPERSV